MNKITMAHNLLYLKVIIVNAHKKRYDYSISGGINDGTKLSAFL